MKTPAILGILAVAVVIGAYLPALDAPFFTDDFVYVVDNPTLRTIPLTEFWRFFSQRTNPFEYLPVRDLSYRIDIALFGLEPWGFHAHNLLLYALCCFFAWLSAFAIARNIFGRIESDAELRKLNSAWTATIATALFAAHPAHVESVAWISGRKDLLSGLFAMMSFWFFVRAADDQRKRIPFLTAATFFFALGILSKVTIIPMAAIAFLVALINQDADQKRLRRFWRAFLLSLPLLIAATVGLALHVNIGGETGILKEASRGSGMISVLSLSGRILGYLTRIALFPIHLRLIYDVEESGIQEIVTWAFAATSILGGAAVLWLFLKRRSLAAFGVTFFVLFCLPFLQLVPFKTWSLVTERFLFLPIFGLAIAAGSLLTCRSSKSIHGLSLLLLVLLLWGSFQRAMEWKSTDTLSTASYRYSPHQRTAVEWYVYGLLPEHHYEEALEVIRGMRDQTFGSFLATYTKSLAAAHTGDLTKADSLIQNILPEVIAEHHYEFPITFRLHVASLALDINDTEEAAAIYSSILQDSPHLSATRYNYGLALMRLNKKEQAARQIRRAIDAGVRNGDAWNNLGLLYRDLGILDEAESAFLSGLKEDSKHWHAAYNLARLYLWQGKHTKARRMLSLAERRARAMGDDLSPLLKLIHQMNNTPLQPS